MEELSIQKVLDAISNSSATAEEKLAIFNALIDYLNKQK